MYRNSNIIGAESEALFVATALGHNWEVAQSIVADIPYDFIVNCHDSRGMRKIQVKTAWQRPDGAWKLSLRKKQNRYNKYSFDDLAVVCNTKDDFTIFLIPWHIVEDKHTLVFGDKTTKWADYQII